MPNRSRLLAAVALAAITLGACSGLKEALTAHVDVVARAASQELSVTRLADLLGTSKLNIPVSRDNVQIVADAWAGYQQLGYAGAHNDSLTDKKAIDQAAAPLFNAMKLRVYMDSVSKKFAADSGSEASYNRSVGGLLAARHILIGFKNPNVPASAAEKDSVRKKAESVRAQVTPANFADMAKKYSTEPGAKQSAGMLGVFGPGRMIPEFENATKVLKPGEISQPIETRYGFHIIQRLPFDLAKTQPQFGAEFWNASMQTAEESYRAGLDSGVKLTVKANAPSVIRTAVRDEDKHRTDKTALANWSGGELTVADMISWLQTFPPQAQLEQQIPMAPDSLLLPFAKGVAERQVILEKANAAHVQPAPQEVTALYQNVQQTVEQMWNLLDVGPKSLSDSAKTTGERERLAAARVERYLDRMMAGQAQPFPVRGTVKQILDAKYEASINQSGIDRAYEQAQKVRASNDSARAASQPKSEVPIPGMNAPAPTPPTGTKAPAPTKKP